GQVAVRHGAPERPGGRALAVDVDPLMIERGVREGVYALLRHLDGVAGTELLAQHAVEERELRGVHPGRRPPFADPPSCCGPAAGRGRGKAERTSASTPSAARMPLAYLTSTSVTITCVIHPAVANS